MKKVLQIALVGAVALAGLTACHREQVPVNPTYDPLKGTLTTEFVFNVSTGNTPATRMTAANTQATTANDFLGITDAQLFAYKLGTSNDGKRVAAATTADKTYSLGEILAPGALDPDGSPQSRRVIELAIPVETNALMFWGKAPSADANANGKITFNAANSDITNHAFSLTSRLAEATAQTSFQHYQDVMAILFNRVVQAGYTAAAGACVWSIPDPDESNAAAIDLKWSDYVTVGAGSVLSKKATDPYNPSDPMSALGEILAEAFLTINTVYPNEVRAGSGPAVHYMMADLYNVIHNITTAVPTTYNEYVAQRVALAVETEILKIVDVNGVLRDISTLQTNAGTSYTDVTSSLDNFPSTTHNLPMGVSQMKVTIANAAPVATWEFASSVKTSALAGGSVSYLNYTYPAEICYYGNSPIRVSDDTHITAEYPDGTANWDNDASWTADWTKNKHVLSTTRSVAMRDNINYGSALFKSTVRYGAATLEDNNAAIQLARNSATEANKQITASAGQFTLSGILIGGQDQTVGWNYLPKTNSFTYVIYDKAVVSATIPAYGETGTANYTLVWDNYNSSLAVDGQMKVYVALELVNNTGEAFWGRDNLIRQGGTFYLVGELDPAAGGLAAITWPTNYALPPYRSDVGHEGETLEATRVFIQDYMTSADFVIGATSLQNAYVTVPDLRSTQISLGLSVDLAWSTGLNFGDVNL